MYVVLLFCCFCFCFFRIEVQLLASLVGQLVKNPPEMLEIPVQFLGWEDSPGEGIGYLLQYSWASLVTQMVESTCIAGDMGSIPVLGRSPGGGNDNPLQYSRLENPMDRGDWQAVQSIASQRVRHN